MIREVDLVSYLPPFIAEYKETNAALSAENPEFTIVWEASDRVLKNQFIETADEYGISRFEKILNILPSTEDTLENRRNRVQLRWFTLLPYTWKMFLKNLAALCEGQNFKITKHFEDYWVELEVELELFGQVEELKRLMEMMFPCNMILKVQNKISCSSEGFALITGGICCISQFVITNDSNDHLFINSAAFHGGAVENTAIVAIS